MAARADGSPLKALPLRDAGQSLRNDLIDLVFGQFLPGLWVASIAWVLVFHAWLQQAFGWHASIATYVLVAGVLSGFSALHLYLLRGRIRRLQLGRNGERVVGQFLEQKLPPLGARILHDIPADNFNLDHVVIARQGVFVIETKTHSKPFKDARVPSSRVNCGWPATDRIGIPSPRFAPPAAGSPSC